MLAWKYLLTLLSHRTRLTNINKTQRSRTQSRSSVGKCFCYGLEEFTISGTETFLIIIVVDCGHTETPGTPSACRYQQPSADDKRAAAVPPLPHASFLARCLFIYLFKMRAFLPFPIISIVKSETKPLTSIFKAY